MPVQKARAARSLNLDVVRIECLIDLNTVDEVIPQAEVQGQPVVHTPVVLDVERVLIQRDIGFRRAAVEGDGRERPVDVVVEVVVGVVVRSGVEGDEERRLVNIVEAGLHVVAHAAHAFHVPREVVAELPFLLLRRLRGVAVLSHGDAVLEVLRRVGAVGADGVAEVGVLKNDLVQLRSAQDPVVVHVEGIERIPAHAPAADGRCGACPVRLRILVPTVANRQVVRSVQVHRPLHREERFPVRCGERAVLAREQPQRVDDLEGVLLSAFERAEVVDLVLHNRAAKRPAVLPPAVFLLLAVRVLLGLRLGVHSRVAHQREPAPAHAVRAALGHDIHDAAVAAAVLGLVARGDEVELLNGLEREELQEAADGVVVVVAAVDLVVQVAAVAAANLRRVLRALRRIGVVAKSDAGDGRGQVRELPAVQWQVLDAADIDDAADR